MGNKAYAHVISSGYMARVDSLLSYAAVSSDVLRRWCFPLVPDAPFGSCKGRAALTGGLAAGYREAGERRMGGR